MDIYDDTIASDPARAARLDLVPPRAGGPGPHGAMPLPAGLGGEVTDAGPVIQDGEEEAAQGRGETGDQR
jgi:hypothetical protein